MNQKLLLSLLMIFAISNSFGENIQLNIQDWTTTPSQVRISGNFNDWVTTGPLLQKSGNIYSIDYDLPDGEFAYKFFAELEGGMQVWALNKDYPVYRSDGDGILNHHLVLQNGQRVSPEQLGLELFEWSNTQVQDVVISGDFNSWDQGDVALKQQSDGVYRAWMKTDRPFRYKYVVDDIWKTESENPDAGIEFRPDGFGDHNNIRLAVDPLGDPNQFVEAADGAKALLAELGLLNDEEPAWLEVARHLCDEGDYARSIALCRVKKVIEGKPSHSQEAIIAEGDIQERFGKMDKAADCWEKIVNANLPNEMSKTAYHKLAKYHIHQNKNFENARSLYQNIFDHANDDYERAACHFLLARTYCVEMIWAKADAHLTEAIQLAPEPEGTDEEWIHLWMEMLIMKGECRWRLGERDEALGHFRKAIELSPWPNAQNVQVAKDWLRHLDES